MASKDGSIPGFKKTEENGASEEALSSAQGAPPPDEAAAANVSPSRYLPPTFAVEEPDYTPETWALNMVKLVRNPPRSLTEKGGFVLDSEDSLSTPEHLSYPTDPSPIARKKGSTKPKPQPKIKKHTRQGSSSSSSSLSGISIYSSSSSSSSDEDEEADESPVAKRARMELVYSWDSLLLGKELGSVALNQHLTQLHGTLSQLTSVQALQIVQSVRLETIVPPETSQLAQVTESTRIQNKELYGLDKKDDDDKDAIKTCARLYESMVNQDVAQNRRQIQQLSPSQLVGRLEHLEHAVASLKEHETKTMKASQELKLINNVEICKQMGFRTPLEKYNSRRPPPPPQQQSQQQHYSPPVRPPITGPFVGTTGPPPMQQGTASVQPRNVSLQKAFTPTGTTQPKPPPPSSLTPPTTSKQAAITSTAQPESAGKDPVTSRSTPSSDGKPAALKETRPATASK